MPRPLKVSRQDALTIAMKVFWQKGYASTSVEDLQQAIGIQRGSFYFNFKDKRSLFLEVLDHYKENVVTRRKKLVTEAASPLKGISLYFKDLIDHSVNHPDLVGCLNTNTAAELGLTDQDLSERLGMSMKAWQAFWKGILKKAQTLGELEPTHDVNLSSHLLVGLTQGINVVSKVKTNQKFLNAIARAGLRSISDKIRF